MRAIQDHPRAALAETQLTQATPLVFEERLSFGVIARCIWRNRVAVLIATLAFAAFGGISAWIQQPVYRATVVFSLVAPPFSSQPGSIGGSLLSVTSALGRLGGSGFAPMGSDLTVNLEVLKSRDLAQEFLKANHLTESMARAAHSVWFLGSREPTKVNIEDAIDYFQDQVLSITPTETPGVYRLAIEWPDPRLAAQWANGIVEFANVHLSDTAATRAERRLQFLRQRLRAESIVPVQDALSNLIADEIKNLELTANVDSYAFRVIDRAFVPSRRAKPHRAMIIALSVLTGLLLISLFVLARESTRGTLYA